MCEELPNKSDKKYKFGLYLIFKSKDIDMHMR